MKPAEVHALAVKHGLTHEQAITATAIAWAESGLNPDAVGDVDLVDDVYGPSVGLYQVRSLRADTGTGKERDVDRLKDPSFCTRSMVAISAGGTNWTPWSVYKNGRYLAHVDDVRAAVTKGTPMKLVTRADWGARSASTSTDITPDGVAVHWEGPHMGTPAHGECAARVRGIQAFHMDTNGWADVAYSAIVCPHGYVFVGRGPGHRTAANGTNDGNQRFYAVCFLGGEGDTFTDEAKQGIDDAIDWLGGGEIVGHRDLTSTACPGDEIYAWAHGDHGVPAPPAPTPPPPPAPEEDDMASSPYTLFNWGGAVWAWSGGDPLPLFSWAQVQPYLDQNAVTIGDLADDQFRAVAPTYTGQHPAAGTMDEAMAAVRARAAERTDEDHEDQQ